MGSFSLGGMTFSSLFKKPETTLYPFEKKVAPAGLKGQILLNADSCILCGICQKTCPCDAIVVEKKERTWACDPFRCVQCGSCVRACPKQCLVMDPAYTTPTGKPFVTTIEVPDPKAAAKAVEES